MGRYDTPKDGRVRNWATVVYSDEAIDKLSELKLPCLVSPWHDSDVNADGEKKKPHKHIMFCFDGKKSREQIKDICDMIGGVGCEPIQSMRSYARYLCHLDNPDKAQYNINDVRSFGGIDYIELINSLADEFSTLYDIIDYLLENHITSLRDFLLYCRENRQDWFDCMFRKHHLSDVKIVIHSNVMDTIDKNC